MILAEGLLLYITPFYFINGKPPQNKFFLCLKNLENESILLSLPTSQDYIPSFHILEYGCNDIIKSNQCVYCFLADTEICNDTKFSFELNTFLFGNEVQNINTEKLTTQYAIEGVDYRTMGKISTTELEAILNCFKKSKSVPNRIKKLL